MIKQILITLALICALVAQPVLASNITGTFVLPNTSLPLANATVTFTLNQAAVVPGSFLIVPAAISCFTSTDGSIKGLPNPLIAPSVANNLISGSIPAGTYYVRLTYTGSGVETLDSPSVATVLSGTGQIVVTAPALQPANATGYKVYIGTADGSEQLQATTVGFGNTTVTSYNASGGAAPSSNNSVCTVQFNDATIPAPTTYRVMVVDVNSNNVPGFPQQWYLQGSSYDVSNGYPVATNTQVRFPQPIIANPSSAALQSVNSPLTVNGYDLKAGGDVLTGVNGHSLSSSGQAVIWYDTGLSELLASVNGAAAVNLLTLSPALPLNQSQGGTNRNAPISSGELVWSDGSTFQGTSQMSWDNTNIQLTATGRFILKSATQHNPPSDSGSVQIYYNSSGDNGFIYAASNDGSGGGSGKPLYELGSELDFETGTPASQTLALKIDSSENATFHGGIAFSSASGTMSAGYLGYGKTVVGSLPSAAAGNAGWAIVVTDSTTISAEGQTCVGSNSNIALAISNGSVWKCF